jgi:hypothetical protein
MLIEEQHLQLKSSKKKKQVFSSASRLNTYSSSVITLLEVQASADNGFGGFRKSDTSYCSPARVLVIANDLHISPVWVLRPL